MWNLTLVYACLTECLVVRKMFWDEQKLKRLQIATFVHQDHSGLFHMFYCLWELILGMPWSKRGKQFESLGHSIEGRILVLLLNIAG